MLTREQIEEIQAQNREKGIPVKNLLREKGIPDHQYFWWKRKYSKPEFPEVLRRSSDSPARKDGLRRLMRQNKRAGGAFSSHLPNK